VSARYVTLVLPSFPLATQSFETQQYAFISRELLRLLQEEERTGCFLPPLHRR